MGGGGLGLNMLGRGGPGWGGGLEAFDRGAAPTDASRLAPGGEGACNFLRKWRT
jgi:hypothetical protein